MSGMTYVRLIRRLHSRCGMPASYCKLSLASTGRPLFAAVRRIDAAPRSDTKKHEPDQAEDQHREPGGNRQEGEHGRAAFGLACFSRGFDDLTVLSGYCHA